MSAPPAHLEDHAVRSTLHAYALITNHVHLLLTHGKEYRHFLGGAIDPIEHQAMEVNIEIGG